ncbi:MAG: aldo/keto reductase [Pseudomonadota bacterium]
METRKLGTTDIDVSVLCLGTMMYGDQISEADAIEQMDVSLDRGINFFDTAELYTVPPKPETQGESERIIGRWMKARANRDQLIIATKVTGRSPMDWFRDGGVPTRLSREHILFAVERSLKNLQTDYIDLYQLHWPDRKVGVFGASFSGYEHYDNHYVAYEETLSTLNDLVKAGKVRHVGLSNETPYGTMQFLKLSEEKGWPRMQSIQNVYNFMSREFDLGLAEIAFEEKVGLLAYSPMAQGVLSGKYLDGGKPAGSRGAVFGRLQRYQTPAAERAIRAYVALADDLGVDPSALANQFVTTRKFLTSNIFGARGMDQLETVFQSLEIKWTDEIEDRITQIHREAPNPCP